MNKRIVAVICVMLVASVLFASCTNQKYYVDEKGTTHVAYTDKNGETVTNENGNVIVIPTEEDGALVTEENGEFVTQEIVTQELIKTDEGGKKIETSAYSVKTPDGWVLNQDLESYAQFKPDKENSTVSIDIQYSPYTYEQALKEVENLIKYFNDNVTKVLESGKEEITLKNGDSEISPVTKFYFLGETKDSNGNKVVAGLYYYVFTAGNYTYTIPCGAKTEEEYRNTDFESVISAINFK